MIKRYLEKYIIQDLKEKMVFISGPRQIGKTTLSKSIGAEFYPDKNEYLNWDNRQDRQSIIKGIFPASKKLLIFDEIHKYREWKSFLKGEFDKHKEKYNYLVTGSARLDIFKKGGDSLLGRYHAYKLHPLSLKELLGNNTKIDPTKELEFNSTTKKHQDTLETLLKFGGFPEIFVKQNDISLRRWHNERVDRLVKEDIRDVENIKDISLMQVLVEIIPDKIGSLFSQNSLREDLKLNHKTISQWVDILEHFYYHFRIYPFQSTLIKSLRKEPKLYLWDWSEIKDEGIKFENFIASHLLKFTHFLIDVYGYKASLSFLRDKEQREVDFMITIDNKPWFSVEVKTTYKEIPNTVKYFANKLKIPYNYLVVKQEGIDLLKDDTRIISASKFLTGLV